MVPFIFNTVQRYLHSKLEEQLHAIGRVRAIILKGRQEGCSIYVSGRYYHKATRKKGKSVFILSHEASTTVKLFDMVERFQDNIPEPLRPAISARNQKQLIFAEINSDYTVGTAGNENVGRGGTIQYFHGSEVGFWEKTDGIQTGIMQSIADMDGTEIILESTANGKGNMFYDKCMAALEGRGDYILIFIPWYWQDEYSRSIPENFELEEEETNLKAQFGLSDEQMYWRRKKMEELGSDWKFHQEYPMTVDDAFVTSGKSLVDGKKILAARKSSLRDPSAPLILGVDPGRTGDRTVIVRRRGREMVSYDCHDPKKSGMINQMELAGRLANIIDRENVAKCFIDVAHGYGVIDRLKELGYGAIVQGVHFNERPLDPDTYLNKRAEILITVRDWLCDDEGAVSIPDDEALHADIACVPDYKETSRGLMFIIPKEQIKKEYGKSPDIYDGLALTFAYPVRRDILTRKQIIQKGSRGRISKGPLKTLNRLRGQNQSKEIYATINIDRR